MPVSALRSSDCKIDMFSSSLKTGTTTETAGDAGASFIGINNRDLHTFRTSLSVTFNLLRDLPTDEGRLLVSESGISTRSDVTSLEAAGIDAVLIGESLMREADYVTKLQELLGR